MKIPRFRSLTFKLTVWYILILGIIVAMSGLFLYQSFKDSLLDELDEKLLEIAGKVHETWNSKRGVSWLDAIQQNRDRFRNFQPLIQVVELEGRDEDLIKEITRSEQVPDEIFTFDKAEYSRAYHADLDDLVYRTLEGPSLGNFPVRVILFPAWRDTIVQVGISLEQNVLSMRRLLLLLLIAAPLLLILASVGGSFIIRKALRPVRSVVETANRITADDLSLRIDAGNRKDEIGDLVETLNAMIARLDGSVRRIRQFSGDVSHELRTPLTVIRGEIEVALRKARPEEEYRRILASALEESRRMEKIIEDLLLLSRMDAVKALAFENQVKLDDLLITIYESREPASRRKGVRLDMIRSVAGSVPGDVTLLERLVGNIVDNAIRYTPEGGRVELALDAEPGGLVLSVRDTGIGISAEALPMIFDRFFVADPSRSRESGGSGLGLSIVKQVADLHGAEVELESEEGRGTLFRIRFPERSEGQEQEHRQIPEGVADHQKQD